MNQPVTMARAITDIRVEATPGGVDGARVLVEWTDSVNQRQREIFHGLYADQLIADLDAVTLQGEGVRRAYLIGRVREVQRQRAE